MRLLRVNHEDDAVQCNNNKLVSGSTSAFLRSARDFLALTVFADGKAWPTVIFTPSLISTTNLQPFQPRYGESKLRGKKTICQLETVKRRKNVRL